MPSESLTASHVSEIQGIVRAGHRLLPRGAGSKTAMQATQVGALTLEVGALRGVLEYQPEEFTFTALGGTPLAEIERLLAEHGQYLPFDPPLVKRGATLGGTVAAGLSGPGRYRYGGIRDFILGVQFLNGNGELVRAGGKVVKNAAGFDLAKLMVGSLGSLGVMVELAFKVFPLPTAFTTLRFGYQSLNAALDAVMLLGNAPLDLMAVELEPHTDGTSLYARLGGAPQGFTKRMERLRAVLGHIDQDRLEGEAEREFWRDQGELTWMDAGHTLVKVPVTPSRVKALDEGLAAHGAGRRYSAGANLAWVSWPGDSSLLDQMLIEMGLPSMAVLGPPGKVRLGQQVGASFEARVRRALDPAGKWLIL